MENHIAVRGLPHALFFPGRDWSGVWLRLDVRRLAGPKEARFGPPLGWKVGKILTEMGLCGSVWVDIEGIRSHMGYKGSGMGDEDLVWYMILKYLLDVGWEKGRGTKSKNTHAPEVELSWTCGRILKSMGMSCTPICCKSIARENVERVRVLDGKGP